MSDLLRRAAVILAADLAVLAVSSLAVAGEKPVTPAKGAGATPAKGPAVTPAKAAPAATPGKGVPAAAPAKAPADPARDAVDKIQKFYESTRDLHAHFDQEQTSPVTGIKKASGEVWLKKPGKMRWEYNRPEKKLMLADGKMLWVYEPDDEQAFKHDLKGSNLPSSVGFLLGEGKLTDEFDVALGEPDAAHPLAAGDLLLRLTPRKPTAQYHHIEFVTDGKTYMVKETVVYDQQGGTNRMRFSEVKSNQGVSDGKFSFTPPPGTRIIKP